MVEKSTILNALVKEIETLSKKKVRLYDDDIFGKNGLLDSLNVLHIMLFIELEFGLKINPQDISLESFGTVNKITNYVLEKL